MNIDTGMAVVIAAVLVFYLRLIILQREKAKRVAQALAAQPKKKKGKAANAEAEAAPRYSVLTRSLRNRMIAGLGVVLMIVGVLMNSGMIPVPAIQAWWWVPTALGILAFSWLFAL